MTATLNCMNSVILEIERLHEILSEDVAGLSQLPSDLSVDAIAAKRKAAQSLEATRRELETLKTGDRHWVSKVLQVDRLEETSPSAQQVRSTGSSY